LLDLEKISLNYEGAEVLHDVTLTVAPKQVVALIGPNGAGKTSLLRGLSGLHPYSGKALFNGESIVGLSPEHIVEKRLIHCPQSAQLFPEMSVEDNLWLGAYRLRDRAAARRTLERIYVLFPRLKERRGQRTSTLSGGERQMVAIGRSLMSGPVLLMLDEPSLGLAPIVREAIENSLKQIVEEWGLTILLVEQDTAFALGLADRVYILDSGNVVRSGSPNEIQSDVALRESYLGLA